MLEHPIRALVIEDDLNDFAMLERALSNRTGSDAAIALDRAPTLAAGLDRIAASPPDVVLLDLLLPDCVGLEGLAQILERHSHFPVIVMTGMDDDTLGVLAVQGGAEDYLVKGRANGGLIAKSIQYAIERKRLGAEREKLIRDLKDALDRVNTLSGLLPICAGCKCIRNDEGYWQEIESYISARSGAAFTHSLCPDCQDKYYPDMRHDKPVVLPPPLK